MISIVIPTYNERETIQPLLERLAAVRPQLPGGLEVLVVDDRSSDGTGEAAQEALGRLALGRLLSRPGPRDLSQAVVDGIRQARGQIIGVMDADLSHPPELLPALAAAVREGEEMAVASRYVPGASSTGLSAKRLVLSKTANWLARPLTPVRDATSGYFVARASVLQGMGASPRGFKILLETLVTRCVRRVREVPYVFADRAAGRSKLRASVCGWYLLQVFRLGWWRLRHPCRRRAP